MLALGIIGTAAAAPIAAPTGAARLPVSMGSLSFALSMWIVGASNFDQSLCGVRQWARFVPAEWTLVLVHQNLAPEMLSAILDEVRNKKHRMLDVPSLEQRLEPTRPARTLLYQRSELDVLRKKILTWTLVEYDRIFSVDTDIYIVWSPFFLLNQSIVDWTEDPNNIAGTTACPRFFNGGLLFFKPDMQVARRLLAISGHRKIQKACEPVQSDQSLLNHAFPSTRWRNLKSLTHPAHYVDYKNTCDAAVVHFVGTNKPFEWMASCARNRTAVMLGPPRNYSADDFCEERSRDEAITELFRANQLSETTPPLGQATPLTHTDTERAVHGPAREGSFEENSLTALSTGRHWWAAYLRDKTVVVCAGPSVQPGLGFYIDLCKSVLRINDWMGQPGDASGYRTTHLLVHKATRGNKQARDLLRMLPPHNILLAGFGESSTIIDARLRHASGLGLQLSRHELSLLPDYFHTKLNDELGIPRRKHALSDTIGVAWALRHTTERPIFVARLDLAWQSSETNLTYSHDDHSRTSVSSLSKYHEVSADARWLRMLEAKGDIRRLDMALLGKAHSTSHRSLRRMLASSSIYSKKNLL